VFANRTFAHQQVRAFDILSLNDNELEGDLPTLVELLYLRRGLTQAGGKLPLFDLDRTSTPRSCGAVSTVAGPSRGSTIR